ncbi:MAG: S41 family peptidase, partial [Candidatus Asgardarchaeia archaeon]
LTSFGKGSVQRLEELKMEEGATLKVTIAKWLTPNGDYISEKGLDPDIVVEFTEDDFNNDLDPQLDKAIEIIKNF